MHRKSPFSILMILSLLSVFIPARAAITVTNLADGETLRYPVALLRGAAGEGDRLSVTNVSNSRPDGRNAVPVVSGRFVVLVALTPGLNRLRLEAGGETKTIRLRYRPATTERVVNAVYVTGSEGDTRYQSPLAGDPQNYEAKIDASMKLMQTFTAERMNDLGFGRRTFRLDLDRDGRVKVHTLRHERTSDELRKLPDGEQYGLFYDWIDRQLSMEKSKNLVLMAFTRFDPVTKTVSGHTALGGGGMGLFGTSGMFAWPDSIRDTHRAFSDSTPVDGSRVYDDSAGRGVHWGLASTTIGAMLHEMGHTFELPHSPDPWSIMSRGFDHFNRAFTLIEPPSKIDARSRRIRPDEVAGWCPPFAAQLSLHPWFQPDRASGEGGPAPTARFDEKTGEIVIDAPNGIGTVTVQSESPRRVYEVFRSDAPRVLRYSRSVLRETTDSAGGVRLDIRDRRGNWLHVDDNRLEPFRRPDP